RFQCRGVKLYDPRADSSVGGSGAQRWDDQSTWTWSENPAVAIYNLFRGIFVNGQWLYGLQTLHPARLPFDNWTAAMSACDQSTDDLNGNPEPTFRCGYEVNTNRPLLDNVEIFRMACNGRVVEVGGIYKLTVGASPAYVMAFDDTYLLADQSQSFEQFPSL